MVLAIGTTKYAPRRQRHPFGQIIDMPKVVDAAGALGAYTLLTQCPQKPFKKDKKTNASSID